VEKENGNQVRRNSFHLRGSKIHPDFCKSGLIDEGDDNINVGWSSRKSCDTSGPLMSTTHLDDGTIDNSNLASSKNTSYTQVRKSNRSVRRPSRFKDYDMY